MTAICADVHRLLNLLASLRCAKQEFQGLIDTHDQTKQVLAKVKEQQIKSKLDIVALDKCDHLRMPGRIQDQIEKLRCLLEALDCPSTASEDQHWLERWRWGNQKTPKMLPKFAYNLEQVPMANTVSLHKSPADMPYDSVDVDDAEWHIKLSDVPSKSHRSGIRFHWHRAKPGHLSKDERSLRLEDQTTSHFPPSEFSRRVADFPPHPTYKSALGLLDVFCLIVTKVGIPPLQWSFLHSLSLEPHSLMDRRMMSKIPNLANILEVMSHHLEISWTVLLLATALGIMALCKPIIRTRCSLAHRSTNMASISPIMCILLAIPLFALYWSYEGGSALDFFMTGAPFSVSVGLSLGLLLPAVVNGLYE